MIWVNFITTSLFSRTLEIMVNQGNHPQMAELFQVSEKLLVGEILLPYIGNVIIPTDELIFFRWGRYTTNQITAFTQMT